MVLRLIYFGILFFIFFLSVAFADDAIFEGEGETVWPVESKEIEMVAETVLVEPGEDGWDAACIFILKNTGETEDVQVGFPDMTRRSPRNKVTEISTIKNFRCFIDGEEIQVEHKKGIQNPLNQEQLYPFAYIWKMSFQKGETHRIVNTYSFKGTILSDGSVILNYILRTGSLWKGNISNGVIEFNIGNFDPRLCSSIKPAGYVIDDDKIRWTYLNFEPNQDIEIYFHRSIQDWMNRADKIITSDSIGELKKLLSEGLHRWALFMFPVQKNYLNYKLEMIIKKVEPFMDVKLYRMLLAQSKGDKEEARRICENYLEKFIHLEKFTFEDENELTYSVYVSRTFLEDLTLTERFLKIQLQLINNKINNIDTLTHINKEEECKRLISERESILMSIDYIQHKKTKDKSKEKIN